MSGPIEAAFQWPSELLRVMLPLTRHFQCTKVSANRRIDLSSSELQDNCLKTLFTLSRFHSQK